MADKLVMTLREIGPCLSNKAAVQLQQTHGLSSSAARQQVSRRREPIRTLDLPFPRGVAFLYLPEHWQSSQFFEALAEALEKTGGAYSRTIWALRARGGIVPTCQFAAATAIGEADGQVSADAVRKRLVDVGLLKELDLPGVGPVTGFALAIDNDQRLGEVRSKLLAEKILLQSVMEWARRLNLGSWDSFKLRGDAPAPKISRFEWDLTAPSFVGGVVNWDRQTNSLKNGFLAIDLALVELDEHAAEPFIYKFVTMRQLRNLGRCLQFVVADGYTHEALMHLRRHGIIPATSESLFGKDVALALRGLIRTLNEAAKAAVDPEKFEHIFSILSKLPGADGTLRGSLFEFVCAELARRYFRADKVVMNRLYRKDGKDIAEVDVRAEVGRDLYFIEAKGLLPGNQLDDEEVKTWLNVRIPTVERETINNTEFAGCRLHFELWTSGDLSEEARKLISDRQASVRKTKYSIAVRFGSDLVQMAKDAGDTSTVNVLKAQFMEHPLAGMPAPRPKKANRDLGFVSVPCAQSPETAPSKKSTSLLEYKEVQ